MGRGFYFKGNNMKTKLLTIEQFKQAQREQEIELQRYFAKVDLCFGALIGSLITASILAFCKFF